MMDWLKFLIAFHIIGTAFGVGGATISGVLFFKFLKSVSVNRTEFNFLKTTSSLIWLGFVILAFSGIGFFIVYRANNLGPTVMYEPRLWAHLTIALVLLLNSVVMHGRILPVLESEIGRPAKSPIFFKKMPLAFSSGAISLVSWYSALVLGAWRGLTASYFFIISAYLALLLAGIILANIIGGFLIKRP